MKENAGKYLKTWILKWLKENEYSKEEIDDIKNNKDYYWELRVNHDLPLIKYFDKVEWRIYNLGDKYILEKEDKEDYLNSSYVFLSKEEYDKHFKLWELIDSWQDNSLELLYNLYLNTLK